MLAGEIGQVRDMLAAVAGHGQTPEYRRTVSEAVGAAGAGDGRAGKRITRRGATMGQAIGGSLPLAAGIALSPVPIIAVVLMLTSRRAKVNGLAFVLGWLIGLGVVGAVVLALAGSGGASNSVPC